MGAVLLQRKPRLFIERRIQGVSAAEAGEFEVNTQVFLPVVELDR
jgi:hypothetical protein